MSNKKENSHLLYRSFCIAFAIYILEQFFQQRLGIASGELLPRGFVQHLAGPSLVITEWVVSILALTCVWINYKRTQALTFVAFISLFGLIQNYSNHGLLLTLAFFYLAHPRRLELLNFQLVLMYVLAGANKLEQGFYTGESLQNLVALMDFQNIEGWLNWPDGMFSLFGIATIAMEFLIPVLLVLVPQLGILAALLFHISLLLFMPGLWGFIAIIAAYLVAVELRRREKSFVFTSVKTDE